MKPVPINAAANFLTLQAREAGTNPLNLFQHFRLPFHMGQPRLQSTFLRKSCVSPRQLH
jgi:hypothetical protein